MKRTEPEGRVPGEKPGKQPPRAPHKPAQSATEAGTQTLQGALGNRALERLLRADASPQLTAHVSDALSAGGAALGSSRRAELETHLGGDLSGVRVHDNASAAASARALDAAGYTLGEDIVVDPARFPLDSPEGKRLIAHEAAHVLQQRRHGNAVQGLALHSQPGDAAEREADQAARAVEAGERFEPRTAPSAVVSRNPPGPPAPVLTVFDDPAAWTPAGAPAAFDAYLKLSDPDKKAAFDLAYPRGNVNKALAALGNLSADAKYQAATRQLLRWIEELETRATSGKTDAQMAGVESAFLSKIPPAVIGSGGWGGAAGATRWGGLLKPAQAAWDTRAAAAIAKFVTWAAATPISSGLKLTAANFEWDPNGVDKISVGAYATVGSIRGKTVRVGFEFVAMTEVAPKYVLSTVVHELSGHVTFDSALSTPTTYAGALYDQAAAKVPGAPSGAETYDYYQSEIYSLLREIPFFFNTDPADAQKAVVVPGSTTTIATINTDPRDLVLFHLKAMVTKWEPTILAALLQGFFKRISADPMITPTARSEFQRLAGLIGVTVR